MHAPPARRLAGDEGAEPHPRDHLARDRQDLDQVVVVREADRLALHDEAPEALRRLGEHVLAPVGQDAGEVHERPFQQVRRVGEGRHLLGEDLDPDLLVRIPSRHLRLRPGAPTRARHGHCRAAAVWVRKAGREQHSGSRPRGGRRQVRSALRARNSPRKPNAAIPPPISRIPTKGTSASRRYFGVARGVKSFSPVAPFASTPYWARSASVSASGTKAPWTSFAAASQSTTPTNCATKGLARPASVAMKKVIESL